MTQQNGTVSNLCSTNCSGAPSVFCLKSSFRSCTSGMCKYIKSVDQVQYTTILNENIEDFSRSVHVTKSAETFYQIGRLPAGIFPSLFPPNRERQSPTVRTSGNYRLTFTDDKQEIKFRIFKHVSQTHSRDYPADRKMSSSLIARRLQRMFHDRIEP